MTARRAPFALLVALPLALVAGCRVAGSSPAGSPPSGDGTARVAIRGGTIYDGSSMQPVVGTVEIADGRIAYVGPDRPPPPGARVVPAKGLIVAPGFIDPHTHARRFLDSAPGEGRLNLPWLMQGVTTIFTGVDGDGTPEVGKFLDELEARGFGTNVAAYVGFGPVRRALLGDAARAPDPEELRAMRALVARAMCQGALGLSTGLFYAPQSFATTGEVTAVAREAALRGGVYDTHQRDEGRYTVGIERSVDEALAIGRNAQLPVHFAHIKVLGVDMQGKAGKIAARIEAARAAGQKVTADQYPWDASGTSLTAALVPGWAQDGGRDALLVRLAHSDQRAKIEEEMAENLRQRGGPHALLLVAHGRAWSAQRLDTIAANWGISPVEAAIRIVRTEKGADKVVSFNMAETDIAEFMRRPWVVTGSDGSEGHPRMYATFPRKFARYVRELGVLDLATFINGSTGRTADMFGLSDRGHLKPGYRADVVIFDPSAYRPVATYLAPRELSRGVTALFVNGEAAILDGRPTGIAAGRAVRNRPPPGTCPD